MVRRINIAAKYWNLQSAKAKLTKQYMNIGLSGRTREKAGYISTCPSFVRPMLIRSIHNSD